MPALDQCHTQVVNALRKDGWTIPDKPFTLFAHERTLFIDIIASRPSNGTHENILLAEIKCFPEHTAFTRELYTAIGQYLIYRETLQAQNTPLPLYLAIPESVYRELFDTIIKRVLVAYQIKTVVINLDKQEVVAWNR